MKQCPYMNLCGGCSYREKSEKEYRQEKIKKFTDIISGIHQENIIYGSPIFIEDGERRRASFAFQYNQKQMMFGFNKKKSNEIIDLAACQLLTDKINASIPWIRGLLKELCMIPFKGKQKKKKTSNEILSSGDVLVCQADNGIDIVLEFDKELSLDHRMIINEYAHTNEEIIRISHRFPNQENSTETLIEKQSPYIEISGIRILIAAGTFMQASKKSEQALIATVLKYVGNSSGKIADLFCGMGTFSYPLSKNKNNKILSVDSSLASLKVLENSIKKNMLHNIEVINKNLFKYPLSTEELKNFDIIIFDPPRAGAHAQTKNLSELAKDKRPQKIIGISCNPQTFVTDANLLIQGGYKIKEITMVDQFIYSPHMELVALFEE